MFSLYILGFIICEHFTNNNTVFACLGCSLWCQRFIVMRKRQISIIVVISIGYHPKCHSYQIQLLQNCQQEMFSSIHNIYRRNLCCLELRSIKCQSGGFGIQDGQVAVPYAPRWHRECWGKPEHTQITSHNLWIRVGKQGWCEAASSDPRHKWTLASCLHAQNYDKYQAVLTCKIHLALPDKSY